MVTASYDRSARVWDANSGKLIVMLKGHTDSVNSAMFSPDGQHVLTASQDNKALLWDVSTGEQLAIVAEHIAGVSSATFSPDGNRVITTSWDGTARLWKTDWPVQLKGEALREKICNELLVGAQEFTAVDAELHPSIRKSVGDNVCQAHNWMEFGQRLLLPGWLMARKE